MSQSQAALELLIQAKDEASSTIEGVANKGGFLQNAFAFATGGLITSGISAITGAVGGLLDGMIGGDAQMENYNTQFEVMTGSMDNAKSLMADLTTMGAKTPFEFTDLAGATQTLLAFGTAQKDIIPDLQMLGDISGGNKEKLNSLSLVFGQVASNGKLMGGDLLQMINAGFNPLNEISKRTGKSMSELRDEMSKGQISFDMVKQAIQDATGQGGQFFGMMDKQSTTFDGLMSTLQDNFHQALRTLGTPIFDKLKEGLSTLVSLFSSPGVQGAIAGFADMLANGIGAAMTFVGNAINTLAGPIGNLISFFGSVTDGATGVSDILFNIGEAIGGPFGMLFGYLSNVADAWGTFVGALLSGQDVMASIGTLLGSLGANIANNLLPMLGAFGQAFLDAIPGILGALGGIGGAILGWIVAYGPTIAGTIGGWAIAFVQWVGTVIPQVVAGLGGLAAQIGAWIQANGPFILATLSSWSQAFIQWVQAMIPPFIAQVGQLATQFIAWIGQQVGPIVTQLGTWASALVQWIVPAVTNFLGQWPGMLSQFLDWIGNAAGPILLQLGQWVVSFIGWIAPMIPGFLVAVGGIALALLAFIGETAFTILEKLGDWTQQFFGWVWNDVLPQLPGWLGNIATALWTFISENAPKLLDQLGQWKDQFFNWVMTSIVPNLPTWLGNIASGIWQWLSQTATDLGTKLVNEWIPAFWNWITGPDGILVHIGEFELQIAGKIWDWITGMAKDIVGKVEGIGSGFIQGIKDGITNGWEAFKSWVTGLLGGLLDAVKAFFGISSPSTVWAAEIGAPIAAGFQVGFDKQWAMTAAAIMGDMDGTYGDVQKRAAEIAAMQKSAQSGAGVGATDPNRGASNPVYTGGGASSGGTGARTMATGLGLGGTTRPSVHIDSVNVYAFPGMDGAHFATSFVEAIETEMSGAIRGRRGG